MDTRTSKGIIDFVNSVGYGKVKPFENDFMAYAVNLSGHKGVAIDISEDIKIKEHFNKLNIANANLEVKGVTHHVVFLYTDEEVLNEHYGVLFFDFLNKEKRKAILSNPLDWFNEWSDLLGNKKQVKMIYDVVGEMKTLVLLLQSGVIPIWDSIKKGTYDISTNDSLYEVKSTINKTETFVTIHNQFQLDDSDKNLNIVFVRLEENETGESIDDLYNQLETLKYPYLDDVNIYLEKIGYYHGKAERYIKYLTHEVRQYKVDDTFPKITKDSFIGNQFPLGIVKVEYTISLDSLKYTSLLKEDVKHA